MMMTGSFAWAAPRIPDAAIAQTAAMIETAFMFPPNPLPRFVYPRHDDGAGSERPVELILFRTYYYRQVLMTGLL